MPLRPGQGRGPSVSLLSTGGSATVGGSLTVSGNLNLLNSNTVLISDNLAAALTFKEGANSYLQFVTTNAAETIIIYKSLNAFGPVIASSTGDGITSCFLGSSALPTISLNATGSGANAKLWDFQVTGNTLLCRTRTDAGGGGSTWLTVTRSGTSISSISFSGPVLLTSTVEVAGTVALNSIATLRAGTATVAGGTQAVKFGSGDVVGIYFGSGAPTVSAAKGALYLRTDGSGVTSRAYINTDGGTTWTAITTLS